MSKKKPNFLILIADDLGFSDLGCYGGEISTPNLDKLARTGTRMTGFHTASACSPTRAMLLSGTDSHLAGLGQMWHNIQATPESRKYYEGRVGYEGILNMRVAALSEILNQKRAEAGKGEYRTMLSGKWHLGLTEDTLPSARGFERNWGLLPGCWHHFKYTPTNQAGEHHPKFMRNMFADGSRIFTHHELPDDFYSSTTYTDKMLEWLKQDSEAGEDRPFFAMMTYTAPHWPIQAPGDVVRKYRGMYDNGPQALREKRLRALVERGLVPAAAVEKAHPVVPAMKSRDWDDLSPAAKARNSRIMEVYAAMVDVLDQNIGRLLDHLEATGELDNTFILFMSDNGAEGGLLEAAPISGEKHKQIVSEFYDNSLDNIGNRNSFVYYGPRWAQASTAPSRMYKGWTTEGGIRCPCIVRYPLLNASDGVNRISHAFTTVMDICPTILELAGIPHPGRQFQGRTVHKMKGQSWLPLLSDKSDRVHDDDHVVGWELFGHQAIRRGVWKAVLIPVPTGSGEWELFHVENDPGETTDLAAKMPEKLQQLVSDWEEYEAETGMIPAIVKKHRPDDWIPSDNF